MPQGWNFEHSYAKLPEMFYRRQMPVAADAPKMIVFNDALAADLGLNADELRRAADVFAGSVLPPGSAPIAQAYAGYQFGHFAMLGDGRAVLLGEHVCPAGRFDIQLKGSGPTPYSRGGDGLAAIGPMLREYIISEAMHALGVPTTRSLAVATTGGSVRRERILQGSVLTRVASSHIRVGTFNFAAAHGDVADLRKLADYAIWRHFPHLEGIDNRYQLFLREVAASQASLIAKWMLAGFVHGVMNTDNMAISGETIDYGPCAFMDAYSPDTVFSSIDRQSRYAYKNQPLIGAWNLSRLAESLLPLLDDVHYKAVAAANAEIAAYHAAYERHWLDGMRAKLGLAYGDGGTDMIADLLSQMHRHGLDYTATLRDLSNGVDIAELADWQSNWRKMLQNQPGGIDLAMSEMRRRNPAVIPRNHRVEEALDAAENGNFGVMGKLLDALKAPFEDNAEYAAPPANACDYRTFCGT